MHNLIVPGGTHIVSLLSGLIKVAPKLSELNTDVKHTWLNQGCHLNILGFWEVTRSKFHTQDPQILGAATQNLGATASSCQGFKHL